MTNLNEEIYIELITDLMRTVGKLAQEEGEIWRLEHTELMEAYQNCRETLSQGVADE